MKSTAKRVLKKLKLDQFLRVINKSSKSQRGFSLIEILVALTLLGLAGTFVAGKIFDQLHEGRVKSAKIQMNSFKARLQEFKRKCNIYPTTDQGLEALISKPSTGRECKDYPPNGFIEGDSIPLDPWDNDYDYKSDGKKFDIISFGNDGLEGGEDQDTDISLNKKPSRGGEE
jgi:general secretion pathway protein G